MRSLYALSKCKEVTKVLKELPTASTSSAYDYSLSSTYEASSKRDLHGEFQGDPREAN